MQYLLATIKLYHLKVSLLVISCHLNFNNMCDFMYVTMLYLQSGAYNLDGLRSLVKLPKLRHFNFSGDHYHLKPSVPVNDDISLYDILIKLKGTRHVKQ